MAITLAIRGDSKTARYSRLGGVAGDYWTNADNPAQVIADASALGGQVLDLNPEGVRTFTTRAIHYLGRDNFSETNNFSVLMRVKTGYTGNPPVAPIAYFGAWGPTDNQGPGFQFYHTGANLAVLIRGEQAGNIVNGNVAGYSPTAGVWTDILFTYDGDLVTGIAAAKIYINGVLLGSVNGAVGYFAGSGNRNRDNKIIASIMIGGTDQAALTHFSVNEFVVWNEVVTPAGITLSDSSSTWGAARTGFVDVAALDPNLYVVPVDGDIRSGVAVTRAGVASVGTLDLPVESNVRIGITYDGGAATGLLDLPAESNVVLGVVYDNGAATGTFTPPGEDYPIEADVVSGVVYKNGDLTGTYVCPAPDFPLEADVLEGVTYDEGAKVGTLILPKIPSEDVQILVEQPEVILVETESEGETLIQVEDPETVLIQVEED